MLCSINDYFLADVSVSGGYALTNLRIKMERVFDVVVPLGATDPVLFDRNKRKADITFNVQRVQATIKDAENFCNVHEATVPRTGDIKLIVDPMTSGSAFALLINAELISHELTKQIGKFTEHAYHITGAGMFTEVKTDFMATEDGFHVLTETSDKILME